MNKSLQIFICLLILLAFINCSVKELKLGESQTIDFPGNNQSDSEQLAGLFKLNLGTKIEKEDLAFLVVGDRDFIHSPSMYISRSVQQPSFQSYLQDNDTLQCGMFGIDICTINHSNLNDNDVFYIGVYCESSCKFNIKAKYEKENIIDLNEQYTLSFNDEDDIQLKELIITMPEEIDGDYILVEAMLLNPADIQEPFALEAVQGNKTTIDDDTYITVNDIWFNGKGFRLDKNSKKFKKGQNIILQFEAAKNSQIYVNTETFNQIRSISLDKNNRDLVHLNEVQYYTFTIPSKLKFNENKLDLSFDVEPYTGVVEFYLNSYDDQFDYENLDNYKWSIVDQYGQISLTIGHQDIEDSFDQDVKFIIAVKGNTSAAYKFLVYTSNLENRQLTFDCTESGYIEGGNIKQYQLDLQGLEQQDIELTLTSINGNMELYLKVCEKVQNASKCKISSNDIKNRESLQNQDKLYYSADDSLLNKITFEYDADRCNYSNSFENTNNCVFVIAVKSNNAAGTEGHYKLTAKHPYSYVQLIENIQVHDQIDKEQMALFKLTVLPDETIEKIVFHVVAISGELDVYIKKDADHIPSADYHDKSGYSEIESLVYKKSEDGDMDGNYYLAITGWSKSYYNIMVKIYRKDKENEGQVSSKTENIYYGNTIKGYLYYNQPETYQFKQDHQYKNREKTRVFLYYQQYDIDSKNEISFSYAMPKVIMHFVNENGEKEELTETMYFVNYSFILAEFKTDSHKNDDKGHYEIQLIHDQSSFDNIMYEFNVSINADDVWRIIPDYGYVQNLDKDTVNQSFEIYLAEQKTVYIELFECIGNVNLEAFLSYDDLEKNKQHNEIEMPTYNGNHLIVPFLIENKGSFYIKLEGKDDNGNLFMVLPHTLPYHSALPHEIFRIPREGDFMEKHLKVDYLDPKTRSVQVSFKKLRCANDCINGSNFIIDDFLYLLHVTNESKFLSYFAKCDMSESDFSSFGIQASNDLFHRKYRKEYAKDDKKESIITFNLDDLPDEELFIQVMGVVFIRSSEKSKPQPYTFIYDFSTINFQEWEKYHEYNNNNNEQNNNNNTNSTDTTNNNSTSTVDPNKVGEDDDKNKNDQNLQEEQNDNKNQDSKGKDYGINEKGEKKKYNVKKLFMPFFFMALGAGIVGVFLYFYFKNRRGPSGLLPQQFEDESVVE